MFLLKKSIVFTKQDFSYPWTGKKKKCIAERGGTEIDSDEKERVREKNPKTHWNCRSCWVQPYKMSILYLLIIVR